METESIEGPKDPTIITRRNLSKIIGIVGATAVGAGCLLEIPQQNQTPEITSNPDKEKEIKEIRSSLIGRLRQLTTKVTEVDKKDNKSFKIDEMNLPSGLHITKNESGGVDVGISSENKTITPTYEVSIAKNIDPGFLAREVTLLAADPPLSETERPDLIKNFDELLNRAKADNNEKVLSLLDRLFSSSAELRFPEGTPVNVTEEEINAVDISSTGIPYSDLSPEEIRMLKERTAKSKKFFEDPSLKKGLLSYEEFKRLKAAKKDGESGGTLNEIENNYAHAIKNVFAAIYAASVVELYSPPDTQMPFSLRYEGSHGGKLKVKDFKPLQDNATQTKAYLVNFYDKTLQLPISSTLK